MIPGELFVETGTLSLWKTCPRRHGGSARLAYRAGTAVLRARNWVPMPSTPTRHPMSTVETAVQIIEATV